MVKLTRQEQLDLTFALQEHAFQREIDLYGVASAADLAQAPKGRRPDDLLPGARSLVGVGIQILDPMMRIWFKRPEQSLFKAKQAVLAYIDRWKQEIAEFLRDRGWRAEIQPYRFIPSVRLNRVFQLAGLGYIGRNQLLITPQYGPRVHLGVVATNAPLLPGTPYKEGDCGTCRSCEQYCPSGAIQNNEYDARKCEAFINKPENQIWISDYGYLDCDMCLRVCPKGAFRWPNAKGRWSDFIDRAKQDHIPFQKEKQ